MGLVSPLPVPHEHCGYLRVFQVALEAYFQEIESQYSCLNINVEICPWGQHFAGHCPHEVLVLKSSYWITENKYWWEKRRKDWCDLSIAEREVLSSYLELCTFLTAYLSLPPPARLLSNCRWRQAEQCLTWPQDPHSQKQWMNVSRHHSSLLWVNTTEGESLAHLFLTRRSVAFSLCLVIERSLWLDAAMQPCWITNKSWLHLDLSTAVSVSKLISIHFFFS